MKEAWLGYELKIKGAQADLYCTDLNISAVKKRQEQVLRQTIERVEENPWGNPFSMYA